MKIIKNKPIPKSRSKYARLLEMEIGDCVEFNIKSDFVAATGFLRKYFKITTKTTWQERKHKQFFLGSIWRIEGETK
tara:strand:- start:929 stop:1159 length:231 start_codon:yes stop_codon:yes gene_type:complete